MFFPTNQSNSTMDRAKIGSKKNSKITLEDIALRKEELLIEIKQRQEKMSLHSQQLFAPFLPSDDNNQSSVIKKFNTGLAIFDGIMLGMKMFKSVRRFFSGKS